MAGLKKKRRIQLIAAGFVFMAAAGTLMGFAFKDGIEFFRTPVQLAENPPSETEVFRLGGLVAVDSLVKDGTEITFVVEMGEASVPVSFTGILPDLFDEGQGVIGTGKLVNGTFIATEILAKHDEDYLPKEVADALKEQGIYQPTGE